QSTLKGEEGKCNEREKSYPGINKREATKKKMMKERFKKLRPPFPLAHRPDLRGIIAVDRSAH
ncbi:MAG TPA: hypothetical protein VLA72_01190, partial [Anaerolineales bacterium]|nr:hypothetical protein [Anaerolineales bacterium]